jgi:hypothetical protein
MKNVTGRIMPHELHTQAWNKPKGMFIHKFLGSVNIKQERQCMYNVILWRIRVTTVAVKTQQCTVCIVEVHVTFNTITILSVAQKCFYGEFMSPATTKRA